MKARQIKRLNKVEQQALDDEVRRQVSGLVETLYSNMDAMILYTLHSKFGFGKKRLLKFYYSFIDFHKELTDYYQMNDAKFICTEKLKDIGIDIEQLESDFKKGIRYE